MEREFYQPKEQLCASDTRT